MSHIGALGMDSPLQAVGWVLQVRRQRETRDSAMRGLGALSLNLHGNFVCQLEDDLGGKPSDATCCAPQRQSSRPISSAPALDLYDDFVRELEAGLAWFDAVVVKK